MASPTPKSGHWLNPAFRAQGSMIWSHLHLQLGDLYIATRHIADVGRFFSMMNRSELTGKQLFDERRRRLRGWHLKSVGLEAVSCGKGARLRASSTRASYLVPAKAHNSFRHSMPLFIPSGIASRFVTWALPQHSVTHSQKWSSDKPLPTSPSNLGCSSPVRKDTTVGDSCG